MNTTRDRQDSQPDAYDLLTELDLNVLLPILARRSINSLAGKDLPEDQDLRIERINEAMLVRSRDARKIVNQLLPMRPPESAWQPWRKMLKGVLELAERYFFFSSRFEDEDFKELRLLLDELHAYRDEFRYRDPGHTESIISTGVKDQEDGPHNDKPAQSKGSSTEVKIAPVRPAKKRGRPKKSNTDEDRLLAERWLRSSEAKVSKKDFCADQKITVRHLDLTLNRERKRKPKSSE